MFTATTTISSRNSRSSNRERAEKRQPSAAEAEAREAVAWGWQPGPGACSAITALRASRHPDFHTPSNIPSPRLTPVSTTLMAFLPSFYYRQPTLHFSIFPVTRLYREGAPSSIGSPVSALPLYNLCPP